MKMTGTRLELVETDRLSHEDAASLDYIKKTVEEFKHHLESKYREDERTKALLSKLRGVRLLPQKRTGNTYNSGLFSHPTGLLMISARDGQGKLRTRGSLNKSIVHELAHATRFKYPGEKSHSTTWKSAWIFFLNIATKDLKMEVDVPCSSVTFYGLQKSDCPGCDWENEPGACDPFTGPPLGHS
jgi:hypothetical protein